MSTSSTFTTRIRRSSIQALVIVFLLLMCCPKTPAALANSLVASSTGSGKGIQPGQLFTGGKDRRQQDPKFLQSKQQRRGATPNIVSGSKSHLSYSPAQYVSEPPYTGADSAGHGYTDKYFWNECGPGASTATIGYWGVNLKRGTHTYSDPYTKTTWNDANDTSYVQYIATQTHPPAFTSAGEMIYNAYPNAYATFADVRDVLNWEASGHSSNYSNYFYAVIGVGSLNKTTFKNDVQQDIQSSGKPLIVSVNDAYLPDWINSPGTSHFITILGYNFDNNTMTYSETCGKVSCNTQHTGIYTINIDTLWNGMVNDNGNGGIIW